MAIRSTARHVDARFEDVLAQAGPVSACWDDGERIIVHDGVAHEVSAAGPTRCRDVLEHLPDLVHDGPGAPLWLGGIAFEPDHRPDAAWTGFPAARFRLPRRQWIWQDGSCIETTIEGAEAPDRMPSDADTAAEGSAAHSASSDTARREQTASPDPAARGPGAAADAATADTGRPVASTGTQATASPDAVLKTTSRDAWDAGCEAITEAIHAGSVTKAVLARCDTAAPTDALAAFLRLRRHEDGTSFWFREGKTVFFGCTPERLARLGPDGLSTHALAGSARRGADDEDAAHALQASSKDVLEHELVAAFLRERLVEAGVQGVHQSKRTLRRLRHVQHLETPIHGRAEGMHLLDIAHHLHPTPAVCGTPRQRSMRLIRSLEGFPRGWYAGSVGWFDAAGQGELCVALRCALSTPDACHLFAGAGIVAGSEPEAEWQETETKLASLREVL